VRGFVGIVSFLLIAGVVFDVLVLDILNAVFGLPREITLTPFTENDGHYFIYQSVFLLILRLSTLAYASLWLLRIYDEKLIGALGAVCISFQILASAIAVYCFEISEPNKLISDYFKEFILVGVILNIIIINITSAFEQRIVDKRKQGVKY